MREKETRRRWFIEKAASIKTAYLALNWVNALFAETGRGGGLVQDIDHVCKSVINFLISLLPRK